MKTANRSGVFDDMIKNVLMFKAFYLRITMNKKQDANMITNFFAQNSFIDKNTSALRTCLDYILEYFNKLNF